MVNLDANRVGVSHGPPVVILAGEPAHGTSYEAVERVIPLLFLTRHTSGRPHTVSGLPCTCGLAPVRGCPFHRSSAIIPSVGSLPGAFLGQGGLSSTGFAHLIGPAETCRCLWAVPDGLPPRPWARSPAQSVRGRSAWAGGPRKPGSPCRTECRDGSRLSDMAQITGHPLACFIE